MKVLLWAPIALFALLSLRALAFVAYQGLNGAAFEEVLHAQNYDSVSH